MSVSAAEQVDTVARTAGEDFTGASPKQSGVVSGQQRLMDLRFKIVRQGTR
jgi:hypothetical protein